MAVPVRLHLRDLRDHQLILDPALRPYLWGAASRCPHCEEGSLFEGFLKVSARCGACGADLAAADSGDGPAVFIILIVGFLVCFSALFVEVATHPLVWVHLVVWPPLILALSLGLLRPFKGLMLAAQFVNRASQAGRDDV